MLSTFGLYGAVLSSDLAPSSLYLTAFMCWLLLVYMVLHYQEELAPQFYI
jgi:hypothetical protein